MAVPQAPPPPRLCQCLDRKWRLWRPRQDVISALCAGENRAFGFSLQFSFPPLHARTAGRTVRSIFLVLL